MTEIPTIDLADIDSPAGLRKVASQLHQAYSTLGFGRVINHHVPQALVDKMFTLSKAFHAQSLERKMAIKAQDNLRGFIPSKSYALRQTGIGESTSLPNLSDSLGVMIELDKAERERADNTYFCGENLWPQALLELKPNALSYMQEMTKLSCRLLQAFALSVGLDKDAFLHTIQPQPLYNLRMMHYYPQELTNSDHLYGLAPHSDYGLFTLVAQDDIGGLQVRTKEDKGWIDVEPMPHSFILNSADMLTKLTHGVLQSTPHRVISPFQGERYSLVYFFQPDLDVLIEPLCEAGVGLEPGAITGTTYRSYIQEIYHRNYK